MRYSPKLGPVESMNGSNIKYQNVMQSGSSVPFISRLTSWAVPPPDERVPPRRRASPKKNSLRRLTVCPLLYGFLWFLGLSTWMDTLSHSTRSGSRVLIHSHSSTSKVQSRGIGPATCGETKSSRCKSFKNRFGLLDARAYDTSFEKCSKRPTGTSTLPVWNIIDSDISHASISYRRFENQLEIIERTDCNLRHEPSVTGVPRQAPDLLKLNVRAAKMTQKELQITNSRPKHVEPEMHAHRRVRASRWEARTYQFCRVAGSSREARVDESVTAGRSTVVGTVHCRSSRWISTAATLCKMLLFKIAVVRVYHIYM